MSRDSNLAEEAIHKMETVPPPAGEDDAYNAATKIGPMARGLVEALMAKAQAEENSSVPPPISTSRNLSIPKAARVPAMGLTGIATAPSPQDAPVQRMYEDVEDGDRFDPTALFRAAAPAPAAGGTTLRMEHAHGRSIVDELDGQCVSALPRRSDAEWTKAPTLMSIDVVPTSTRPLAPLLEPAAEKHPRRSTLPIEIAIFVGTFLLVAIPAALAYWHWIR
jgi:hypothetical protein